MCGPGYRQASRFPFIDNQLLWQHLLRRFPFPCRLFCAQSALGGHGHFLDLGCSPSDIIRISFQMHSVLIYRAIAGGLTCMLFDGSGLSRISHFLLHFRMCPLSSTKGPHKILIGIVLNLCINLGQTETLRVPSSPVDIYSLSPQLFKSYFLSVGFSEAVSSSA